MLFGQLVYTLSKSSHICFTKSPAVKNKAKLVRCLQCVRHANADNLHFSPWNQVWSPVQLPQCVLKTKHLWKEGYSQHFKIRVCDALSQETEWCPAFLHLTLLSIEPQDELQIKQSSPLPGTHLRLYCEQRSAAAGTERFEAEIILSAISYKYLTEKGGRGERKRQGGGQAGAVGCRGCLRGPSESPVTTAPWRFLTN